MAKKTTKKEEVLQEVVVTEEPKEVEVKAEEKPAVEPMLTIEQVMEEYRNAGIHVYKPDTKGDYRIMGKKSGSSLNILKRNHEYVIYSTDEDLKLVREAKMTYQDLTVEAGTNARDKARVNKITCKTVATLRELLKVYATNPLNQEPIAEATVVAE